MLAGVGSASSTSTLNSEPSGLKPCPQDTQVCAGAKFQRLQLSSFHCRCCLAAAYINQFIPQPSPQGRPFAFSSLGQKQYEWCTRRVIKRVKPRRSATLNSSRERSPQHLRIHCGWGRCGGLARQRIGIIRRFPAPPLGYPAYLWFRSHTSAYQEPHGSSLVFLQSSGQLPLSRLLLPARRWMNFLLGCEQYGCAVRTASETWIIGFRPCPTLALIV